jgi:amidophosphoribosyltransferase
MCGIIGIYSHKSVSEDIYDGLIHLQHRGQDAAGILTYDTQFHLRKGMGLVRDVIDENNIPFLSGNWGLGHTRYTTAGSAFSLDNAQPFVTNAPYGIGIIHNGNLTNYDELKNELTAIDRYHCNSQSDTETILGAFASSLHKCNPKNDIFKNVCTAVKSVFDRARGAYSIIGIIADYGMFAFRDPHGIRPLVWGTRKNPNNTTDYIFSSENAMYYPLGFTIEGSVAPGEVIFIDKSGTLHRKRVKKDLFTPCVFEYVYLARPDAFINDISVYRARLRMGQNLAKKWKRLYPNILPEVVVPIPFTSNTAALSLAGELGVRYTEGIYKNQFIGRTFIMPGQEIRKKSVMHKLSPQPLELLNKDVMLLDDSIVRGTTSREVVKMVREAGAKKVYLVATCPPIKYPDFYGIDIPTCAELIAHDKTEEEIRDFIGADILLYQDIDALVEAVTRKGAHGINRLSMPYLDGWYVTGDIDKKKIEEIEE